MRASEFLEDISRRGFLGGLAGLGTAALVKKSSEPTAPAPEQPQPKIAPVFKPMGKDPEIEIFLKKAAMSAGIIGEELAQFLAQMKHESWDFTRLKEVPKNKNYFKRMYDPKYSPRIAKILGNVKIGDGERFHGRGFVQLTGRENYTRAEKALGIPLLSNPDVAANPEIAAKIAIWFWTTRVKPFVSDFSDTRSVTRRINPALKGLDDRHNNFIKYIEMLQPSS